jgi:prepilin-type N-terminal cleavage/methylation domain-containing protein
MAQSDLSNVQDAPIIRQSGFTLLELSIVLVIIGLLVGGVFVGRDLIKAAQARSQVSQIEKLNIATNGFKIKYKAIPGDISNAASIGIGTAGGPGDDGNGNGRFDPGLKSYPVGGLETHAFWHHLSRSGMLEKIYTQPFPVDPYFGPVPGIDSPALKQSMAGLIPMSAVGFNWNAAGGIVVAYPPMYDQLGLSFSNAWLMATSSMDTEDMAGYSGSLAYALDRKTDDGLPYSGNIVAVANGSSGFCSGGACYTQLTWAETIASSGETDACVNDSGPIAQYNVVSVAPSVANCALLIRAAY